MSWGLAWCLLWCLVGFLLMGVDKRRARQKQWRVPEKALFLPALLGGTAGCILGMYAFRHKTRHWYFKYGMPALLLVQLGLAVFILCVRKSA